MAYKLKSTKVKSYTFNDITITHEVVNSITPYDFTRLDIMQVVSELLGMYGECTEDEFVSLLRSQQHPNLGIALRLIQLRELTGDFGVDDAFCLDMLMSHSTTVPVEFIHIDGVTADQPD